MVGERAARFLDATRCSTLVTCRNSSCHSFEHICSIKYNHQRHLMATSSKYADCTPRILVDGGTHKELSRRHGFFTGHGMDSQLFSMEIQKTALFLTLFAIYQKGIHKLPKFPSENAPSSHPQKPNWYHMLNCSREPVEGSYAGNTSKRKSVKKISPFQGHLYPRFELLKTKQNN